MAVVNLVEQLIGELRKRADKVNQLEYGELSLTVQNGRLIRWDVREQFKVGTDPKNGRSER